MLDADGNAVAAASVQMTAGDLSAGYRDTTHTAEDGSFCLVARQGATVSFTATTLDDSGEELTAELTGAVAGNEEYSGALNPVMCSASSCADIGTIQFANDGPTVGEAVNCSAQCKGGEGYCGSVPCYPSYCTGGEGGCTFGFVDACGDDPIASCVGTGTYTEFAVSLYQDSYTDSFCGFCDPVGSESPALCVPVTCNEGQIEVDGACAQTAANGMQFTLEWLREGHDLDINLKTLSGSIVNYNTNSIAGCTLDVDDTDGGSEIGAAVENVNYQTAADGFENGTYEVWGHNYSAASGDAPYTLGVY
ncbi:MAG: hypothetical protein ACJAYU_000058 [Bradymonadia bacterium]